MVAQGHVSVHAEAQRPKVVPSEAADGIEIADPATAG
jgi:hypothetical protein